MALKMLTAAQVKAVDAATCASQNCTLPHLVWRAAHAFVQVLDQQGFTSLPVSKGQYFIFCGKGNNGADGLAIGSLLAQKELDVVCFLAEQEASEVQQAILKKAGPKFSVTLLEDVAQLPLIRPEDVIIDALLGIGINKPAEGLYAQIIRHINQAQQTGSLTIAVDIPSGLYPDQALLNAVAVQANYTISFELPKLAFMMPENERYVGSWIITSVGLDQDAIASTTSHNYLLTSTAVKSLLKTRSKFAHKGHFGRALIAGGSLGKIGAIRLAAEACLRVGAGLVTAYVPKSGLDPLQTSLPEAMVITDQHKKNISAAPPIENYNAIGIGPGMGTQEQSAAALKAFLEKSVSPVVLDADAINLLGLYPFMQELLPAGSILTPHAREFRRLAGASENDYEALERLKALAKRLNSYVLFKGAHTAIAHPDGEVYFNATGNPGMATAGSGDVLTGMIVGLLAQGYTSAEACHLGVWLHGLAGDLAAQQSGYEALVASDIIRQIGNAYQVMRG